MLPLLRMTWALNRRLLFWSSPLLAFYLCMLVYAQSGAGGPPYIIAFNIITSVVTLIITFQGLTLELDGFLLSLPVTRAQVVRTKYLTSLLGLAAGVAIPMSVSWMAHLLVPGRVPAPGPEALGMMRMTTLNFAFYIFLFLPFIHHFGPQKGFLLFSLTVILAPSAGLAWWGLDGAATLRAFFKRGFAEPWLALQIALGVGVMGLLSLTLSTWSYRRRAF